MTGRVQRVAALIAAVDSSLRQVSHQAARLDDLLSEADLTPSGNFTFPHIDDGAMVATALRMMGALGLLWSITLDSKDAVCLPAPSDWETRPQRLRAAPCREWADSTLKMASENLDRLKRVSSYLLGEFTRGDVVALRGDDFFFVRWAVMSLRVFGAMSYTTCGRLFAR